jgi:hypothetical protein
MDANIFNIITTGILAVAAILAYLVQRARYLREIEPDLDLIWPTAVRISNFGATLRDFWAFFIDLNVKNCSKNHAINIRYEVELWIFPDRSRPDVIDLRIRDWVPIHPTEILAGRNEVISVYCGSNYALDLGKQMERFEYVPRTEYLGFHATIKLSYYSRRELILCILLPPWSCGRVKYLRKISQRWRLEKSGKGTFVAVPWKFPEEE